MKASDDHKMNEAMRQLLQKRFLGLEADFGKAVDDAVFDKLEEQRTKRPFALWRSPLLFLAAVVGVAVFYLLPKSTVNNGRVSAVKMNTVSKALTGHSANSQRQLTRKVAADRRPEVAPKNGPQSSARARAAAQRPELNAVGNPAGDADVAGLPEHADLPVTERISTRHDEDASSAPLPDPGSLTGRPMHFSQVLLPEINALPAGNKKRFAFADDRLYFLLEAAPSKQYYNVQLRSGQETRIQDVSFSSPQLAIGYKISAGVQKSGWQLLLHYNRLNGRIDYESATDKFVTIETGPGQYKVERLGELKTLRVPSSTIGFGLKKRLDFRLPIVGNLFGTLGGEYARQLGGTNAFLLMASASAGKDFALTPKIALSVAPHFDYGLNKLSFVNGQMQLRQFQYGLSIGLKLSSD